ncbi:MAG: hypothetical protein RLZZ59_192 [Pseudomonadota bacterium]|jgi:glycosyltransferase involved in cell wall biosynthesis
MNGSTKQNLISAFIITKNEEKRIARAINSIKSFVDEIIVVDSGSTDDTVKIAKKLGAKTYFNEWPGYVAQKAYAESLCKHDWILNIDADEEISSRLQNEIEYIFSSQVQDQYKAYKIKVTILHRFDKKPRLFAPYNSVVRLYNKNFASFKNSTAFSTRDSVTLNDGVDSNRAILTLYNSAYHYSGISLTQLTSKANFYSDEQAKDMLKNGRKPSKARVYIEFIRCFLKAFIARRYFVFGYYGFIDSIIFAFARFLRMAKARELFEEKENIIK